MTPDREPLPMPIQSGLDSIQPPEVGKPYNPKFDIADMYTNILGREADPEGMASWINAYNAGTSLDDIRQGFLNSQEYLNRQFRPTPNLEQPTPYSIPEMPTPYSIPEMPTPYSIPEMPTPYSIPEVAPFDKTPEIGISKLYRNLLGREADPEGFKSWLSAYNTGMSLDDIYRAFLNSPEYLSKPPKPERSPVLGGMSNIPTFDPNLPVFPTPIFDPTNTTTDEDMRPKPRPIGSFQSGLGLLNTLLASRQR